MRVSLSSLYLLFCRGLVMFRLSMAPWPAAGSTPSLGSAPRPLVPAGPQLPFRGGPCCLGCPLVRAPQVVRVTGWYLPPPGGWTAGQVGAGQPPICSLRNNQIDTNQVLLYSLKPAAVESHRLLSWLVWCWSHTLELSHLTL